MAKASGSGPQEMNGFICKFKRDAKRSISGIRSRSVTLWKISGLNFHSVRSLNCLDNTSASVFIIFGICETDIHTAFSLHHI